MKNGHVHVHEETNGTHKNICINEYLNVLVRSYKNHN